METGSRKVSESHDKSVIPAIVPTLQVYSAILDNCAEAIVLLDNDGVIIYQNSLLFKLLGFIDTETTCRSIYNYVHSADLDAVKAFFVFVATEPGVQRQVQYRAMHKDTGFFWVMASATSLLNQPGVNAFVVSLTDITERKQQDKKLADTNRELSRLFNNINDVLFSVDMKSYKLLQVSPACEKIYGYTAAEFMQSDDLWQKVVYEADRPVIAEQLKGLYAGITINNEYRVINKDGSVHWIDNAVIPTLDEDGTLLRIDGVSRDVTNRKKAEEALNESTALLNELFESAPEAILIFDQEQRKMIDCNANALKAFGYSKSEFKTLQPEAFSPRYQPDGRLSETVTKEHQARLAGGENLVFEWEHRHASGKCFSAEVRLTKLHVPGRNLARASIININEQKSAKQNLLKTQGNLRSLLDNADTCYVLLDMGLNVVAYNKVAEKWSVDLLKVELQEGINYIDALPVQHRATGRLNFARVMAGEKLGYETFLDNNEGGKFWYYLRMYPIYDEACTMLGLCIAATDINQRKAYESRILESEARYRSLFQHMHEGIAYCEMLYQNDRPVDFVYHVVNERFGQLTGLTDVTGKTVSELIPGFLTDHPEEFLIYDRVIKTGRSEKFETYATALALWFDITVYHRQGNHFVLVFSSITERKKSEADILALNELLERKVSERTAQLAEANKELEAFSYTVSHDLQAPLRVISGFTKILYQDYKDKLEGNGVEYVKHINNSVQRMSRLTRELLAFAQLGKVELAKKSVDMGQMVNAVIAEIKLSNPGIKAHIKVHEMPPAKCDEGLMKQVWANLVTNAVKYSQKKETPEIEIGSCVVNNTTAFFIKDNGAGFDMKYADKLFGVFKRLHAESDFEGHGVGLALVHRIITRHGGRIWAEAEVDKGATFYFTIPQ